MGCGTPTGGSSLLWVALGEEVWVDLVGSFCPGIVEFLLGLLGFGWWRRLWVLCARGVSLVIGGGCYFGEKCLRGVSEVCGGVLVLDGFEGSWGLGIGLF